jgi:two-component system response regulator MprA
MNLGTREVKRGDRSLDLTKTEFDLLESLMRDPGKVVSRNQLYEEVWGIDFETSSNSLDVYVGYIRRKTEAGDQARVIHTVRGVGYVLREDR